MNLSDQLNKKVPTGISLLIMCLMTGFVLLATYMLNDLERRFYNLQDGRSQLTDQR